MEKTIKIREEVHNKLADFGKKTETFSDIIERLLDESNTTRK